MSEQKSLFDIVNTGYGQTITYPEVPGFQFRDTSKAAAEAIAPIAQTLRDSVLRVIKNNPSTADEVATLLGKNLLSIRPRVAELAKLNLIYATPRRRKNHSGKPAIVWRAV
jgi:hypothetical protein